MTVILPVPSSSSPALEKPAASVDIVVPVYNECRVLEASIRRLHAFLSTGLTHLRWRIVIADNASTDGTALIATALALGLSHTVVIRLAEQGRGRALRTAWTASDADLLCYMDVDLSTDLRALEPVLSGLVSGHSQLAIGTRLAPGSRVVRGRKREFISRSYNRLLRLVLGARFSDAQCGFKAIRADAARELLPDVRDQEWFFDTELLVLAQRRGMRIGEVAVDWVDDEDSRVDIVRTAMADLRGVTRLCLATPVARFLLIGVLSTLAYVALFLSLRGPLGAGWSNALALAATAVANTQANRRFTFELRGRRGLARQHAAGALVYMLALALTAGALDLLHRLAARPSRWLEATVLVAASVAATACRYVALRSWVFRVRGQVGGRLRPAPRSARRARPGALGMVRASQR
jgi:putative flippase GtrA